MNEIKRSDGASQELRSNPSAPKSLRQKQAKININLLKGREVFLTDNQTDQTKSSNQAKGIQNERLEHEVKRLQRQNAELKECIVKLKASQFYGINEEKVKNLIRQNENFKAEMRILRNQLQKTMIEKDFLQRNNRVLKQRYQQFTKQNSRLKTEQSRTKDYQLIEDIEDFLKEQKGASKSKRSISGQRRKMLKRKVFTNLTNKPEEKTNPESKKQQASHYNQEYYLLRNTKSNPKKSYP